ncbi:MAG: fructose-6-phosphate aldolase [Chloroflexi bacterium]|nr:fructose-6-phosphate aldolase [Chloroflexota bacterium]
MKFFLDTANVNEIRQAADLGVLDGVTTNPSLVAKEKRDFRETIIEICGIVDGPVSAEVVSLDWQGMVEEARATATWAPNVVIKIPLTADGLKATKILCQGGIRINATLVFSVPQGILAAKAGAAFVSPFLGRLDDIGHDGMEVVRELRQIYQTYGFSTEIIAASIRHSRHVVEAAKAGAHIATLPWKTLEQLVKHPLTDIGLERFLADWRTLSPSVGAKPR